MSEKPKSNKYVPPRIVDLSGSGAHGGQVEGSCEDGSMLTFETCGNGGTPAGGTCAPSGFVPSRGYCDLGDKAVEGCTSGNGHI